MPLHPAQLDIYPDEHLQAENPFFNVGGYTRLAGSLDAGIFLEAVRSAGGVFDAFQMRFWQGEEQPVCYYDTAFTRLPVTEKDLSGQPDAETMAVCWMQERIDRKSTRLNSSHSS